jgi:hypothetical protein
MSEQVSEQAIKDLNATKQLAAATAFKANKALNEIKGGKRRRKTTGKTTHRRKKAGK